MFGLGSTDASRRRRFDRNHAARELSRALRRRIQPALRAQDLTRRSSLPVLSTACNFSCVVASRLSWLTGSATRLSAARELVSPPDRVKLVLATPLGPHTHQSDRRIRALDLNLMSRLLLGLTSDQISRQSCS